MPAFECACNRKQERFFQGPLDRTELRHVFSMRLRILSLGFLLPLLLFVQLSFSQSSPYSDQECLSCHGKPEIAQIRGDGTVRSLYVDPEEWNQDIHHTGSIRCVDCHTHANPYIHFREGFIDVDCSRCHPEEAEEYQKNIHTSFAAPSPGKELPLCYHCHTKHHVLRHEDPASSVSESSIEDTCGACHAEVMVKGILKGRSLGKISGHRKGDISERFDMRVCISCHYDDSAHGAKRVYKDFCARCHDVRSMASRIMGPTHLNSKRAALLNYLNSALVLSLVLGVCLFFGCRSRGRVVDRMRSWLKGMTIPEEDKASEAEKTREKEEERAGSEARPEHLPGESGEQETEPQQESTEEQVRREESSYEERPEEAGPDSEGKQEPDAREDKKEDQNIERGTTEEEEQIKNGDKEGPPLKPAHDQENRSDDGEKEAQ